MSQKLSVAVVGATGLVGRTMLKILLERNFPFHELHVFASERSAGQKLLFKDHEYTVKALTPTSFEGIDIALFSAGSAVSKEFGPIAARSGCVVIDNGSYWRMHPEVPLVVPEVNPEDISLHKGIIANPNCSTIQMVVALKPLHDNFVLRRVVVSTYQSISGAGQKGVDQLHAELEGKSKKSPFPHPIAFNNMFHPIKEAGGPSEEENKMQNETKKIMHLPELLINATCVRLPVLGGHGESVMIETEKPMSREAIIEALKTQKNLIILDDPANNIYPTIRHADDKDETFVGRIRMDQAADNVAYFWVVADNLRKGAATNAVQIAELLLDRPKMEFTPIAV